MSTTYILRYSASDLTEGGQEWGNKLLEGTGAAGSLAWSVRKNATDTAYGWTDPGIPGADGVTGNYTVEMDVSVGNTALYGSIQIHRVSSDGTVQTSSSATSEQQLTAGVKTFTFTSENLGTWASGDRLRVDYIVRNSDTKNTHTFTQLANSTDSEVVAPWSATFTATGAATAGGATTSGSGTFTAPVFSGTGTPATGGATASGSGTMTPAAGSYSGTGAPVAGGATTSGSGTMTPPTFEGTGAPSIGGALASGSGTMDPPVFSGTGVLTIGGATLAGVGQGTPETITSIVDPDNGSGTDYLSINLWEAGEQDDLTAANEIHIAECRVTGSTKDTTQVALAGWTTDEDRYFRVTVRDADRHRGVWGTSNYTLAVSVTDDYCLAVQQDYAKIDGLQVDSTAAGTGYNLIVYLASNGGTPATGMVVSRSLVRQSGTSTGAQYAFYSAAAENGTDTHIFRNSKAYDVDFGVTATNSHTSGQGVAEAQNVTVYGGITGFNSGESNTLKVTNCIGQNTSSADFYQCQGDYNVDEDSTAPGANGGTATLTFRSIGGKDFHLAAGDTTARNAAQDLSAQFTDDCEGQTRVEWDIGADEFSPRATGAPTAGGATLSGSGTFSADEFTGTGTPTAGGATCSGTGTYTPPTFTGTGTPAAGGATAAGTGTFTAPVYSGSGTPEAGGATAAGTGTHEAPVFSGTGTPEAGGATAAGVGLYTSGAIYSGTGAPETGGATCSGTGTFTAPVYSGSGTPAAGGAEAAGSGTHTPPTFEATGAPATGAATASGAGTFTMPTYTGTGSPEVGGAVAAGAGTFVAPVFSGTGALLVGAATLAGAGPGYYVPGGWVAWNLAFDVVLVTGQDGSVVGPPSSAYDAKHTPEPGYDVQEVT